MPDPVLRSASSAAPKKPGAERKLGTTCFWKSSIALSSWSGGVCVRVPRMNMSSSHIRAHLRIAWQLFSLQANRALRPRRALSSAFVNQSAGIEAVHLACGLAGEDLHLQAARADELHQHGAYDTACGANAHVGQVRFGIPSHAGHGGRGLELTQLVPDQTGRHTDHRRVGCAADCGKLTRHAEGVAARDLDLPWVIALVHDPDA